MKTLKQKELEKKQLGIILKLNQLTHEGKLQWRSVESKESDEEYAAEYRGRRFRLVAYKDDSLSRRSTSSSITFLSDLFKLYVYDADTSIPVAEIPPIPAMRDLVTSVRYKTGRHRLSPAEQLDTLEELDALLGEDID